MSIENPKNENIKSSEEEIEVSEEDMQEFKDKFDKLKKNEMQKKEKWIARGKTGEEYNPHFDYVESKFLGKREFKVYEKYNEGITPDKFNEMRSPVIKDLLEMKDKNSELIKAIKEQNELIKSFIKSLEDIKEGRIKPWKRKFID